MVSLGKHFKNVSSGIYFILLLLIVSISAFSNAKISFSDLKAKRSSFLAQIKKSTFRLEAIVGSRIKLTCSIDLDDINFFEAYNYKV